MNASSSPEGRSLRLDLYLWAILAVHGALLFLYVLYVLPGSPLASITYVYEGKGLIPMLVLGMLAPWAGLPGVRDRRERLFWLCWTGALGVVLIVRLLYLVDPELEQHDTGALTQDVLYLTFYLLMILSIQLKPDRPETEGGHWPVHPLEIAGTGVFVLVLLVYFIGVPHFLAPWEYDTWIPSLVMYWTLDCFIFLSLLYLRQTSAEAGWRILYTWLALAVLCWIFTDFAEILYYADIHTAETYGLLDYLWYAPWLFIGIAGRVRVEPAPEVLGAGRLPRPAPSREGRSRAGWLVIAALALPVIHFGVDLAGFMDPDTRFLRELLVLVSLLALLGLAYFHQRAIENRVAVLAWEKEEAEARKELLAEVVEQAPDIILLANADARVWYANAALSSAGQIPSEVLGYGLEEVLGHAEPGPGRVPLKEALETGTGWEGRGALSGSRNEIREDLITVSPVRDGSGEVTNFVAMRRDVTHRTRMERHARQTQRMNALAKLSGGIAHHFNNSLATISDHAEILADGFPSDAPEREDIRGILAAVKRSSSLVDRLLLFSQTGEERKTLVPVAEVVKETVSLLRPSLPGGTNIAGQIQDDAGLTRADRRQIHEAFYSLFAHRIGAMAREGGTLRVWVDRVVVGTKRAEALGLAHTGDCVHVAVRDAAPDLEEDEIEQIFDPFVIEDDLTRAADLSLPIVHGAVEASGGAIVVEQQPGGGTLFQLYFPVVEDDEEE